MQYMTECLDGYIGENCSSVCPLKRYGANCSKICDCPTPLCHHVYGCTFTTGKFFLFPHYLRLSFTYALKN